MQSKYLVLQIWSFLHTNITTHFSMFLLRYSVIDGIYAISSIRENKRLRFLLVYINDEIDRCGNCSHVLKETFKINMKTDCQVIVRVSVKIKLSGWELIRNLISGSIFHQFDTFKRNISLPS